MRLPCLLLKNLRSVIRNVRSVLWNGRSVLWNGGSVSRNGDFSSGLTILVDHSLYFFEYIDSCVQRILSSALVALSAFADAHAPIFLLRRK